MKVSWSVKPSTRYRQRWRGAAQERALSLIHIFRLNDMANLACRNRRNFCICILQFNGDSLLCFITIAAQINSLKDTF